MKGSLIQERISRLAEGIQADCRFAAAEPRGRAGCNCRRGDVRCHPEIGREIPDAIVATTADASELTSIAIVRFNRVDSSVIFNSGNYEVDGRIGSIHTGKVVNGDLQPGSSIIPQLAPEFDDVQRRSGLPTRVEPRDYLRSRRLRLPKIPNADEHTFAILVYGFGTLLRVDSLRDGVIISSRYLKPIVTEEEGILNPECDDRLRRQQATGRPTVQ
jgi:hypothetical protein